MALTDSLISYWKLDEASGNALDAHSTNDLTETSGTIASATGKISNCRDFEDGDSEYFVRSDNAALSTGDIDFTIQAWVNFEALAGYRTIISKSASGTTFEYHLDYSQPDNRIRFFVESSGATYGIVLANTLGAPSTATWYHIIAWHDATANTVNISVNNGTADSTSHSAGVRDGSGSFYMGGDAGVSLGSHDGLIDEVGFWKRVLTSGERTSLYNAGSGLAYPFSSGATVSQLCLLGVG